MASKLKGWKKIALSAGLSAAIAAASALPALAAPPAGIQPDTEVSNRLQMQFNALQSNIIDEDILRISWDVAGTNTALKQSDFEEDAELFIQYYVNRGPEMVSGNVDSQRFAVLLEVPDQDGLDGDVAVNQADGDEAPSFRNSDDNANYYVLAEDASIDAVQTLFEGEFGITFGTSQNAPFSANLLAVKVENSSQISLAEFEVDPLYLITDSTTVMRLDYMLENGSVDGSLVIDLSNGVDSLVSTDGIYGIYQDFNGPIHITDQHWDPVSRILTLPLSETESFDNYRILLDPVYAYQATYSITFTIDADGDGVQFTPYTETIEYNPPMPG